MAKDKCVDITKLAGSLDELGATELLADVKTFIETNAALGKQDQLEQLLKGVKKFLTDEVELSMVQKRNLIINAKRRAELADYVGNFSDPGLALKAFMGGTVKKAKGALNSIDARGKAIVNEYLGKFVNDLEKADLLELYNNDALEKEIAQELWEIRPDGTPGISGRKEAQEIAAIIHKYQQAVIQRLNSAGAWIKSMPGYITRQTHDMIKIRRAGYDAWKEAVLPLLDEDKTFGPMLEKLAKGDGEETQAEAVDRFLKGAYDGLVAGLHKRFRGEVENDIASYAGGYHGIGSLAKKMSQYRILHFKDAESWLSYNDMFGTKNLREAILNSIEHGGRAAALMEGFGTNPESMFENTLLKLKMANRDNIEALNSLNSHQIQNLFKELDGSVHIPGSLTTARIGAGIRAINNMSKLGAAVISSISDIPFQASELRFQGHNIFSAYANVFKNFIRGRGNTEEKEIARLIGVGLEGVLGELHSRFSVQDSVPGMMSKIQQRFFKLNGMEWWNDAHKTGIGLTMSNHLAEMAGKTFHQLDDSTVKVLSLYNIGSKEWNTFRNTVFTSESGNKYLTPDRILSLSKDEILKEFPELGVDKKGKARELPDTELEKFKQNLATTWQTYFTDRVDFAVPHPGAAERAMMTHGTQPGTALGEAVRFIMQFKSFPLSAMRKGMGRELYGSGAETITQAILKGKGDLLGMAHLIASTTLFGYLTMAAKDLSKGREPRDPFDIKTAMAAFSQGGGMGIYGDFMFGEFSRYGRSFLATLAGPTIGQLDDLAEIYTRMRNGDDPTAQGLRLALNNTPFLNLFYTRAAMDYLILYQLQEMANPGFLHRMEARIQRENEQQFYLPPSSLISRGGQGGLFESIRR